MSVNCTLMTLQGWWRQQEVHLQLTHQSMPQLAFKRSRREIPLGFLSLCVKADVQQEVQHVKVCHVA